MYLPTPRKTNACNLHMEAKELEILFQSHRFQVSCSIQGLYQSHTIYVWYIYLHLQEKQTIHVAKYTIHASWFFTFSTFLGFFLQDPFPEISCFEKSLCQVASDSALQGKKLQRSSASSSNEPSLPLATSRVGSSDGKVSDLNANSHDGCIYVTSNDVSRTYLSFGVFGGKSKQIY